MSLLLGHSEKRPLSGPFRERKLTPPQDWDLASFSPNHSGLKGNFESALRAHKGLVCPGELISGGLSGMVPGGGVVGDPCSRHCGRLSSGRNQCSPHPFEQLTPSCLPLFCGLGQASFAGQVQPDVNRGFLVTVSCTVSLRLDFVQNSYQEKQNGR